MYCDDFQQSSSGYNKGSAGFCYFLPVSQSSELRRYSSAVRIISLTPPGVSTNDILHYIVDDLVTAASEGIDGTTPGGERVKIFVDVVGFLWDYPAATSMLGVLGHNASAPCTICTFRRLNASKAKRSRYGYKTHVHANKTSLERHAKPHLSLQRSGIQDRDEKFLGIAYSQRDETRKCLLMHLSEQLRSRFNTTDFIRGSSSCWSFRPLPLKSHSSRPPDHRSC